MAGDPLATVRSAGVRGLGAALAAGLASYATFMLQIDDCERKGKGKAAQAAYKQCRADVKDQESDALWASILAGVGALGWRGIAEGGYDFRRQRSGSAPKPADIQAGTPGPPQPPPG